MLSPGFPNTSKEKDNTVLKKLIFEGSKKTQKEAGRERGV